MKHSLQILRELLAKTKCVDFLPLLLLRLYLVPVFWMAGTNKIMYMQSTVEWFGSGGLGLPLPWLMAHLAAYTEVIGAICLLIGFAVRWISIPLMVTMLVAIFAVHWENGWMAIASSTHEGAIRLSGYLAWLEQNHSSQYEYITEFGSPVLLQNGIEFAATYFIMLLTLFFFGAGKYFSFDYWIGLYLDKK